MKTKGVIFDLDGTLYDNSALPAKLILYNIFHLRMLYSERIEHLHMSGRYYGPDRPFDELLKRISMKTGYGLYQVKKWYLKTYMPSQVKALRKYHHSKPWVLPLLKELKSKGIKLACFSEYICVGEKLSALGIDPALFDVVTDASSAGGLKPCRRSFEAVANAMGLAPSEIIVVGDREDTDGAGAEAANMKFELVPKADFPAPKLPIED